MKRISVFHYALVFLFLWLMFFPGSSSARVTTIEDVREALDRYKQGETKQVKRLLGYWKNKKNPQEVRLAAAVALGETGHPDAVSELIEVLNTVKEINYTMPIMAARGLEAVKTRQSAARLAVAWQASRSKFEEFQTAVLPSLGGMEEETIIPLLLKVLKTVEEDNNRCQELVAAVLQNVGNEKSVPALIEIAENPNYDERVREMAVQALGNIGSRDAIPALLRMLEDPEKRYLVTDQALGTIVSGKDTRAILILMEALIHTREEFLLLEQRIIEALEKMGDPRAVPVLVELAQDERKDLSVRLVAMETLGMIGNEVALQGLLELMKDPRNYIFYNVVEESVIKIGGDRGLEALRQTVAGVQEAMSRKTE